MLIMKKMSKRLVVAILLVSFVFTQFSFVAFSDESVPVIKNVIYMIPDGGGFALFDFANAVKEQGGFVSGLYPYSTKVEAGPMHMKDYLIGTETTRSNNNAVTDSAASGTALSSGYKTNNNYVGVDPEGRPHATILEAAQLQGKRAGIVSTYEWTNATPAAFTAHNISRSNYPVLSEQIVNQGLDVVLGTGFGKAQFGNINEASKRGYTIIDSKEKLAAVSQGDKIWGNVVDKDYPFDINLTSKLPTLAEMTQAAIAALDGSSKGFFLMVEGSKVDGGGHSNNIVQAVGDYLAFDAAFKVAVDYAKTRTDTIVIATPDHDTGGFNLPNKDEVTGGNPNSSDYAVAVAEVRNDINSTNGVSWTTTGHTGRNCGVWMYAPEGILPPEGLATTPGDTPENRSKVIDNTAIAPYLADLMGVSLSDATEKLFVDVTSLGKVDLSTSTFTFHHKDVKIKANQSTAIVDGNSVDLDGKVAVFSNNKFYVPLELLQLEPIPVKKARYFDGLTGKVLVKGQIDEKYAGEYVSLLLYKKSADNISGDDIGYVDQLSVNTDGSYIAKFNFKGNIDDYYLMMYLGEETITDSVTTAQASYSWLDASVNLTKKDDSFVSSKIKINNYYDLEGLSYIIILSFYDENNKLLGIKFSDNVKTIKPQITIDLLETSIPEGTVNVKSTIWSDFTHIISVSDSKTIKVN